MPSSKPARRFQDIVDNAGLILADASESSEEQFKSDRLLQDATLFRLLRISEAATKLGPLAEEMAPDEPWRQIRAFGNALRHEYDSLALGQVWIIIQRDLPNLLSACERAIETISARAK